MLARSVISAGNHAWFRLAYSVNGIRFAMIWEGTLEQFVKDATLFNVQVILDFVVTPVGQTLRMVIDLHYCHYL